MFNNISGYFSGGLVGNISQSVLENSRYLNNSFSNYLSFNLCVVFEGIGSNISGCIEEGSTIPPSTQIASTLIDSTRIESTIPPQTTDQTTSFLPSSSQIASNKACYYNVPNCQNCENGNSIVQFDPNLFNISCILVSNKWIYSFKNKTSNTIMISNDLIFEKQSVIYIDGNFNQDSSSKLIISISQQNNNNNNNNDSNIDAFINVNGCVSLNGNIDLILDERPSNNQDFEIDLISYNCSTLLTLSDSQVRLETNYPNDQCDSISKKLKNQPNTLSISISTSLNKNCGKIFFFFH